MRRRLFLHIGHPKCASSTLQEALALNVQALRERGFLVADRELRFPEAGPQLADPVGWVARACERREAGLSEVLDRFDALRQQLGDRFERAVVSAESLSIPGAEYLSKALRHVFHVSVIYYVRRQDDFLVSSWAQWGCKQGMALVDYVERELEVPQPNYLKVLRRWQPDADHVRVRPLHPSALIGGDVVRDFFAAIEAGFEPEIPPRANTSLDLALLEVFAESPFLFRSEHDLELVNWLRRNEPSGYAAEKATLGRALRDRIHDQFEPQNRTLHAQYFMDVDFDVVFGRVPGPADDGSPPGRAMERAANRVRRVLGLQMHLLRVLHRRVARLERKQNPG